jgi:hypothetical protein
VLRIVRTYAFATAVVAAMPGAVRAQIATDRPGAAFNPVLVEQGVFQVEAGVPALARSDGARIATTFPLQLRFGVIDRLELRLGGPTWVNVPDAEGDLTGFGDVEAGLKVALTGAGAALPVALMPSVVLPVGNEDVSQGRASYALHAMGGAGLGAVSLTGVAGAVLAPSGDSDRSLTGTAVLVAGVPLTSRWSVAGETAWYPGEDATAGYLGAFTTLLLTDDVQLDAWFDRGITDTATDWLYGIGISFRFDQE